MGTPARDRTIFRGFLRWLLAAAVTACVGSGSGGCEQPEDAAAPTSTSTTAGETTTEQKALVAVAPPLHVPSATQVVSAGGIAQSAHYQMNFSLGEPAQNQDSSTSSSYQMQGGLVGATRRLK